MPEPASHSSARGGSKTFSGSGHGRLNSVGLNPAELDSIFKQLDGGDDASRRRESARMSFRKASIGVEIVQPSGGRTQINVACRNLSRTGLGFLHSSYVHVGTAVALTLRHHDLQPVRVPATVVRCRHVQRHIHDVGVRFEAPINVRDFISMDPLSQAFTHEMVDPTHLKGNLLLVAEYEIEQACVRAMLRETSIKVVVASGVGAGIECAGKGVSIILCDDSFEKDAGVDFVCEARKAGLRCPIILMSADTSGAALERFRSSETDAFLAKPLDQNLLIRAIAEFLLAGGEQAEAAGPLHTTLPADSPLRAIAESFVDDLHAVATAIESLAGKSDIPPIRRHCMRIGGSAMSLGYGAIAKMAGSLATSLEAAKTLEASIAPLNAFVAACRGACKPPIAAAPEPAAATPTAADVAHAKPAVPA